MVHMPGLPGQATFIADRVIVTKTCQWCSQPATIEVGRAAFEKWVEGEKVQNVWPSLGADQREMLISGTHPECWELMWAE